MPSIDKLLAHMRRSPRGIRFVDLARVCEYSFGTPRQQGSSHRVYQAPWPGDPRVNIQNDHGEAKPYQVRRVLAAIEKWEREQS